MLVQEQKWWQGPCKPVHMTRTGKAHVFIQPFPLEIGCEESARMSAASGWGEVTIPTCSALARLCLEGCDQVWAPQYEAQWGRWSSGPRRLLRAWSWEAPGWEVKRRAIPCHITITTNALFLKTFFQIYLFLSFPSWPATSIYQYFTEQDSSWMCISHMNHSQKILIVKFHSKN